MSKTKRIILCAGGTGGHVFPAISIAKKLSSMGYDVCFSTDRRGVKYLGDYSKNSIVYNTITSSRILLYISLILNIMRGIFYLLFHERPLFIMGFGGYPSIPLVFAGQILGIKTIIHEQNANLGKANRLLSKFAREVITSFYSISSNKKYINIGNPTRYDGIYNNIMYNHTKKILIIGGSQGASIMSDIIADSICHLEDDLKREIFVYHQSRESDIENVMKKYDKSGIKYDVKSFFNNMDEIYQDVSIVISRSGSSSIFEIIGFKRPSILIPYSKSINGDQKFNAKFMEDRGYSIVFDENNINVKELSRSISNLFQNSDKLFEISNKMKSVCKGNTTDRIVEEILKSL